MQKPQLKQIFSIQTEQQFADVALQVFRFQAEKNVVYKHFISSLKIDPAIINRLTDIPFLPIEFFKHHAVVSSDELPEVTFTSSGTTGLITSRHLVTEVNGYIESFRQAFHLFYGDISRYCILALLPAYMERPGSSLVYMADDLIRQSGNPDSGFYLYNHEDLYRQLQKQQAARRPTLLLGVTFALLDFVEQYKMDFPELIVMETGGMKGRRKEMIREELHMLLCEGFGVPDIHSEYGMTELLSQAYSKGNGIFNCPPWMQIFIRDTNDPFTLFSGGKTGGVNIVDLANINSCSFLATQDLGKTYKDGSFEILGRFDNSDIRGCNLLVA